MDPDWLSTLLGGLPSPNIPQGAPITTPEELEAARAAAIASARGMVTTYPGPPEAAGPTGMGSMPLPSPPPPEGTAPALTASVPPPPPAPMGGGPMAGAPESLFPWLTPGPGGATPTTPVPSATPAGPPRASAASTPPTQPEAPKQEDRILAALRGLKAPAPPVPQHIVTPHPPATHAISPANLANLFASLGISPAQLPQLGRRA